MTTNTDPVRALAELAERAVPFLRDEAAKYDDDGSNEPLELVREIETALASLPSDESALSSASSAFDGSREAAPCPHARGVDCDCANPPALASAPPSAPADVDRLVRELDVALNGPEGAAPQASLCDLVGQVQQAVRERGAPLLAPSAPVGVGVELRKICSWKHLMSYNESYFGEPEGELKSAVYALERALAQQPAAPSGEAWRPMETAPRDGTLVRLLVEFEDHATEDVEGPATTIGSNSFDHTGDDEWQFAGWSWEQDCYTSGVGKPVGWLPMLDSAPQRPAAPSEEAVVEKPCLDCGVPVFAWADSEPVTCLGCHADRHDAAPQQPAAVDDAMVERAVRAAERFSDEGQITFEGMRAALTAALAAQPGGSDNG